MSGVTEPFNMKFFPENSIIQSAREVAEQSFYEAFKSAVLWGIPDQRVLFKRLHSDAIIPKKQRIGDAGFDLHAAFGGIIHAGSRLAVRTNVAVAIPSGYVGLIKGRSGLATKHGIAVLGGVIDENYRGELVVLLHNTGSQNFYFKTDDRVAQLIVVPVCPFEAIEVDELPPDANRGEQAFGSSGV